MATSIGSLAVMITGNSAGLSKELKKAESETGGFARRMASGLAGGASSAIDSIGNAVSGIVGKITSALTSPGALIGGALTGFGLGALVVESVQLAAEVEDTQASFRVLLNDAGKAKTLFADIRKFASETPLGSRGLSNVASSLLGAGVALDQIIPTLRVMGDLAQGDEERLKGIATAYLQVRALGKLQAEELNQFAERQVPLRPALAQTLGVSEAELGGLIERGKVGFSDLQRAMLAMTSEGGRMFGLMAEKSKTFNGLVSSLKDNLQTLASNFGQAIIEEFELKPLVEKLTVFADQGALQIDKIRPILRGIRDGVVEFSEALFNGITNGGAAVIRLGEEVIKQLREIKAFKDDLMEAYRIMAPIGYELFFRKPEANANGQSAANDFIKSMNDLRDALRMPINEFRAAQQARNLVPEEQMNLASRFLMPVLENAFGAEMGINFLGIIAKGMRDEFARGGNGAPRGFVPEPPKLSADQIKFAQGIREQMRPSDMFARRVSDIQANWKLGGMAAEEQAFALAQAFQDAAKGVRETSTQFASAMTRGSAEAASIRFREQYGQQTTDVKQIWQMILDQEKRQAEAAVQMARKLDKAGLLRVK